MQEPAQCLWGTPTGSEKDNGGSFRTGLEPAVPDVCIAAKARIAQAHFRAASECFDIIRAISHSNAD